MLRAERARLAKELLALTVGTWTPPGWMTDARTRADSLRELIRQIDVYLTDVAPRLQAQVDAGDLPGDTGSRPSERLASSCARILAAVGGTSAVADLRDDVAQTVRDVVDDARVTGIGLGALVAAGAIVYLLTRK